MFAFNKAIAVLGDWTQLPGKLVDISCYNFDTVIGCNAAGVMYNWAANNWVEIAGRATRVATGQNNHTNVWHVNKDDNIWNHQSRDEIFF